MYSQNPYPFDSDEPCSRTKWNALSCPNEDNSSLTCSSDKLYGIPPTKTLLVPSGTVVDTTPKNDRSSVGSGPGLPKTTVGEKPSVHRRHTKCKPTKARTEAQHMGRTTWFAE